MVGTGDPVLRSGTVQGQVQQFIRILKKACGTFVFLRDYQDPSQSPNKSKASLVHRK